MKAWLIGASATALLAAGFYLAAPKPAEPVPAAPAAPEAVAVAPSQPPAALPPAVLDRVVDVTDIDHLLEPPPIPATSTESGPVITRVGYEEPASPVAPPASVPPIPKSQPDEPRIIIQAEEEITRTEEEWPTSEEFIGYSPDEESGWESEFRPEPAERWLDWSAVTPLLLKEKIEPGFMRFGPRVAVAEEVAVALRNPLTPLQHLTDSDLIERTPRNIIGSLFPASEPIDRQKGIVLRAYGLFHVGNQRPASRMEWYSRWYGEEPLPRQAGMLITPKQYLEQFDVPQKKGYLDQRDRNTGGVGIFF